MRANIETTTGSARWNAIWPWLLLWGAAPMPLYIWLVVGMLV